MAVSFTVFTPSKSVQSYEITLDSDEIRVGRSPYCHLQLPFETVSAHHFSLVFDNNKYFIYDAGSTNGTFVNNKKLQTGHYIPASENDVIRITDIELQIRFLDDDHTGLTLEESHGISRKMLSDVLSGSLNKKNMASLGVINGPERGTKCYMKETEEDFSLGSGEACWMTLSRSELQEVHAVILKRHNYFAIKPESESTRVDVNGVQIEVETPLDCDDIIELGEYSLRFYDPLERLLLPYKEDIFSYYAEGTQQISHTILEAPEGSQPSLGLGPPDRPPELPEPKLKVKKIFEEKAEASEWGVFEMLLLFVSTLLFIIGIVVLLVLFDVVSINF